MSGPYYFAWVTAGTAFNPAIHARMDEDIFEFVLQHGEGNFATLTLVIANPGKSLLHADREQWAWFAEDDEDGNIVERFFGRVIGVPDAARENELQVTLLAKPSDYQDQKQSLAEDLKVVPYWDPILIDPAGRDDPDAVLTARTQSWVVDPVTHELDVSDNIVGEEGLVVFSSSDVYDENGEVTYGQPPARSIEVTAEFRWTQKSVGEFDVSQNIAGAFPEASFGMASSYTADDLTERWPQSGAVFGSGWQVISGGTESGSGKWVSSESFNQNMITSSIKSDGASELTSSESLMLDMPLGVFKPELIVGHDVERSYTERVTFTLDAGIQSVLSEGGGSQEESDEIIRLSLATNDLSEPVDEGGEIPIGDIRRNAFMKTDRGHDTMRYLLARARASLIDRARCVMVAADVDYERRFDVSLKHSAQILHPVIPGDVAQGKVVEWKESGNGDTGDFLLQVTIGCCPGTGGSVSAAAGTGVYAQDGYMQSGYQQREDASILVAGDVTFTEYLYTPNDDGVDFLSMGPGNLVLSITVTNPPQTQRSSFETNFQSVTAAEQAYRNIATEVCMELQPLEGGPFETVIPVMVSDLAIPKQVDLAAA